MSIETEIIPSAEVAEVSDVLAQLRSVDRSGMLGCVFEMPRQIILALEQVKNFHCGETPLDRSRIRLVGLGGSAVAGELLRDMLAPRKGISIHRGTQVPRDKAGVLVSSYSGNTIEIIELTSQVIGGLRTVVLICSGGELEKLGRYHSLPVLKIPSGYQPRAAVGWSMASIAAIAERWGVHSQLVERLNSAAEKLNKSLNEGEPENHTMVRAALPMAKAMIGRNTVIFHSLRCTGAARRFAAQINENAKQPAFPLVIPEAMHNGVEGIGGANPDDWCLVFMTDSSDPVSLQDAISRTISFFSARGFPCMIYPSYGENQFESTLSRLFTGDMTSLFLSALRGLDPTLIPSITEMKKTPEPIEEVLKRDRSIVSDQ